MRLVVRLAVDAIIAPGPLSRPAPVLSAEVFVIALGDNRHLVYAPVRRSAFVANTATVNILAALQQGHFDEETDRDGSLLELLRRLEIVDAGPEELPISVFAGDPEPTTVTLFLTTACNLRCTYCYASAGDTPLKVMSPAVARRGIDFVAANAHRRGAPAFEVLYHGGGEPTTNWRTLTRSLEYARKRASELGLTVRSATATNGFLLERRLEWIIANLDSINVSFDGLPEVQDVHRPTVSGAGSSERVMRTIRRLDEVGFPYGLRMTVTADQIPFIADSVDFICATFKPRAIQVEPAYQIGRWSNAPSAETAEFLAGYREAQSRAARHGYEISFSAARVGALTNHFCGISQDGFALSPDGNVSACYEVFDEDSDWSDVFFYGRPAEREAGYVFDATRLGHLRRQAVEHRDYCRGCFAKWTCAGDCYHKSLTVNDSLEFQGSDRCTITRELTKDQILAKISQSGGLYWHEVDAGCPQHGAVAEAVR